MSTLTETIVDLAVVHAAEISEGKTAPFQRAVREVLLAYGESIVETSRKMGRSQ